MAIYNFTQRHVLTDDGDVRQLEAYRYELKDASGQVHRHVKLVDTKSGYLVKFALRDGQPYVEDGLKTELATECLNVPAPVEVRPCASPR